MGGKFTGSLLHNIEGVDWDALADSGKIVLRVRVQTWACWTGWERRVFWNWATCQKRCLLTWGKNATISRKYGGNNADDST